MLYHQGTLRATGWWRRGPGRRQKSHPTIQDDSTIRVGAAILRPTTIAPGSKNSATALVLDLHSHSMRVEDGRVNDGCYCAGVMYGGSRKAKDVTIGIAKEDQQVSREVRHRAPGAT